MSTRYPRQGMPFRVLSAVLIGGQIVVGLPILEAAAAQSPAATKQEKRQDLPSVKVNRTVPEVARPSAMPRFSAHPSDKEISAARVFEEPLTPLGEGRQEAENDELGRAVMAYLTSGGGERTAPLEEFLVRYPGTAWRASLRLNLGLVYRRTGYFTRALSAWEEVWLSARGAEDPAGRAVGDRAFGELAELNARLGRYERLEELFAEIEGRDIRGSAAEKVSGARQGLWLMRNEPENAFRCGPMAIDRILAYGQQAYRRDAHLIKSRSSLQGMSLTELRDLANSLGMGIQMAQRGTGAQAVFPAVVHWKAGHYAALIKQDGDRYLVQDPTFGDDMWISRAALDEEGTGYALIPLGALPPGWRPVGDEEGGRVWGKGNTTGSNPPEYTPEDHKEPETCEPNGMAAYAVHTMLVSLNIVDTPLGYAPPRGPAPQFTVTYNQREIYQPQTFSYSNLGPKWTMHWLSYVEDDPAVPSANANVYRSGGGRETSVGFEAGTQSYAPHYKSRAVVARTSTSPIRYERRLPDGSVEVFAQPDGAATSPRKVFLTERLDPQGNALTLTFDSSLRIVAVTDALGQVTTLSYELANDPLKITEVTDPFGRLARFEYTADGRLQRITDVIGLVSGFTYGAQDRITTLTTPYGTTNFAYGEAGLNRWIETTDPLGAQERVEYVNNASVPASEPVPAGFTPGATYLNFRNTFYWDKRAMALAPGDYSKAQVFHWLHGGANFNLTAGPLESEKKPLENRVWYSYPNQPHYSSVGSGSQPTHVRRILDDGTTQTYQYEYNSLGKVTRKTDPLGRATINNYDTNGIDLLEVRQVNGQSAELLQSFTYNAQHRPLTVTDAAGQITTYTYLSDGRPQTIVSPPRAGLTQAERTTTYSYYPDNAPTGAGKLQTITGPSTPSGSPTTSYTYDGYGRVRTTTDSDGYTLTYDYDALDRMTKTTYLDGTYEETAYNRLDEERKRDRLGRWTHFFYDALRRVVAIRDPRGGTTTQQWCNCGSLDKVIDANGNATTLERDLQGRVTREVGANGSAKELTYETTTSRLKKVKDAKNQEIQLSYFLDDNLQQLSYVNAQVSTPNASFTYDPVYNRPATMTDGTGTTTYAYSPIAVPPALGAGRLASVDGPLANDTVSYNYDELGRVVNRPVNGINAASSYDALGRTATLSDAVGSFSFSYEGTTRRLSAVTYPNGQTASYAYYPNSGDHRLQDIHYKNPASTTLSRFTYLYDAVGDIKTWTQQADTSPAKAYDLGYDAANELTEAIYRTTDPTPVVLKRYGYAYDVAGNRTTEQIDDIAMSSSHDNMNRLTSQQAGGALAFKGTVSEVATVTVQGKPGTVTPDNRFQGTAQVPSGTSNVAIVATDPSGNVRTNTYQVTQSAAGQTFSYDANGNLIGDGAKTYEWDARDRLAAVVSGTQRSEFTYDGKGHRVRIVEKDNSVVTSDRWFLWCDEDICEERDSGGGNVRRRFLSWGMQEDGVSYYYTRDHLRSIRELTDAAGAVRARYDYDPYGRVTKLTGDKDSSFRYTEHYFHAPTALTLAYYRAYDSGIGRWISPDPDGPADGPNLYAYVSDNPINTLDPQGLAGTCWTKVIKVTKVETCTAQILSSEGAGCGPGGVATLCATLTKKAQGKKGVNLDPPTCPAGETCTNLKPQTFVELFNETMTFTLCGGWPVKLCCTFTATITGKFIGEGEIGTCCSDPTGKKCQP